MIDYIAALLDIDFYPKFIIKIKNNIPRTEYYYPVEINKNWEWREN